MIEREQLFQDMMRSIARYAPYADESRIRKAFALADKRHASQVRRSGEPYIIHPVAVAEIVAEMGLDTDAIVASLLHDCLEDTATSYDEIATEFGTAVAQMVEGVTKLTRVQYSSLEEQQMENLRKMFMAMSKDIRVILIKIADRLHNMRTMQYQKPEKQVSKSMETMEIYAPLAHRLGMQKIKWELEDRALQYLDPTAYKDILDFLEQHHDEAEAFMNEIQDTLRERMQTVGIQSSIYGRIKHIYSIYRKMKAQHKSMDELYDLYAFRVVVDTIPDCYNVLGHIHDLYHLVPGRFKDYISTPKPNMYQSLHTTVIGKRGIPFEVQIRTWDMHQTAEYGVAAHWKYKDGISSNKDNNEKEFEWVRRLLESQQDTEAEDYIHSLKVDMFDDEVFVFTPRGKVISLPAGSTPIDFAYAVHSAVGNSMVGAKVNNRIAGYDWTLNNGDVVEILTSKSAKGPSRDWLNICKSNQARIKIKQWFKKEKREENVARGKASMEGELRRLNLNPSILQEEETRNIILKKLAFDELEDLFAAVGYGGMTAFKAVNRIKDEILRLHKAQPQQAENIPLKFPAEQTQPKHRSFAASGVIVEDIPTCMVKFSRCCTPVPGDDIVGFITKGYGVSVHRKDCVNAQGMDDPNQSGRWVKVSWASDGGAFSTSLEILSLNRDGLVMDLATAMTALKVKVTELSSRALNDGTAITNLTFQVSDVGELEAVKSRLRAIQGVTDIHRGHGA
ncbi:MAG: bifunctional (p)ppGpp synthetase/guanosine-3',5'-bis(diphosphate) 3'-pyrophosphohydrolase [Oscillospiraceae bacterium]|nr:bifunctional (p)ppGpp synthetase/guanosine-3',5'-bis(diphosphate) 3'-pyrophosphohydrolase [Oscillospiraceae bacterium]